MSSRSGCWGCPGGQCSSRAFVCFHLSGFYIDKHDTTGEAAARSSPPRADRRFCCTCATRMVASSRVPGAGRGPVRHPWPATVGVRFAASYRDDDGWFENDAPGVAPLGAVTGLVLRSVLTWQPSAHCDITAMFAECGSVKSAAVAVSDSGAVPERAGARGRRFRVDVSSHAAAPIRRCAGVRLVGSTSDLRHAVDEVRLALGGRDQFRSRRQPLPVFGVAEQPFDPFASRFAESSRRPGAATHAVPPRPPGVLPRRLPAALRPRLLCATVRATAQPVPPKSTSTPPRSRRDPPRPARG